MTPRRHLLATLSILVVCAVAAPAGVAGTPGLPPASRALMMKEKAKLRQARNDRERDGTARSHGTMSGCNIDIGNPQNRPGSRTNKVVVFVDTIIQDQCD